LNGLNAAIAITIVARRPLDSIASHAGYSRRRKPESRHFAIELPSPQALGHSGPGSPLGRRLDAAPRLAVEDAWKRLLNNSIETEIRL
jgi:hypothetical protein